MSIAALAEDIAKAERRHKADMSFFKRIKALFRRRKQKETETSAQPEEAVFSDYISQIARVLTYFRRMEGIARRNLELAVLDTEEQPAWKVAEALERLVPEVRLMYFLTGRAEQFEELQEEIMEATGLLVELRSFDMGLPLPGNLILDLREWKNQLDIIKAVSYNTMAIR